MAIEINNNQLKLKLFDEKDLIHNINNLSLLSILKTQKLSLNFIINYILNDDFQIMPEEKEITIDDVISYQDYSINQIINYKQL